MTKLPEHTLRPILPSDDFDNELVSDLIGAGFAPMTFGEPLELTQADKDFFTVRDFLEFVIRLTNERLAVNPSVAAHFQSLRIPSDLYETKELPYDGTLNLSFNG